MRQCGSARWALISCALVASVSVGALSIFALPVSAQQRWDAPIMHVQAGVYREPGARRDGENRWGWVAGLQAGAPIAHRIHVLGALSFLRVHDASRVSSNRGRGGYVYADETIAATIGVGLDLIARRDTRLMLGARAGPFWSRDVETDRFGSPLPSVRSEAFSLSAVTVESLSFEQALASNVAAELAGLAYFGGGVVAPGLRFGLAVRLP